MSDPGSLLATLAQSSAAIVAIVGGFLVSRLVQLSSEREGLRRQLGRAHDELGHVEASYNDVHGSRLRKSMQDFRNWVTDTVMEANQDTLDRDGLLAKHIPRGSSKDEMGPYLDSLIEEIAGVREDVERWVLPADNNRLDLDDLRERGLTVPDGMESLYRKVVVFRAAQLPRAPRSPFGIPASTIMSVHEGVSLTTSTDLRRLDESIREEQDLRGRKTILESEVARITKEIERIGRPVGVTSAIVILAIYSALGIVAPVVVLGIGLATLADWLEWLLVSLFLLGLTAVLAYILWYAKTLNDPIEAESTTVTSGGTIK